VIENVKNNVALRATERRVPQCNRQLCIPQRALR
jgi:hypothetical protein